MNEDNNLHDNDTDNLVAPPPPYGLSSNTEYLELSRAVEVNKSKQKQAFILVGGIVGFGALAIMLLSILGLRSNSYSYVQSLSNYASFLVWGIGLSTGILAAYLTTHPANLDQSPGSEVAAIGVALLIFIGLAMGIIPGLIIIALYLLIKTRKKSEPKPRRLVPKPVNIVLVALSFILGVIPGLILAFILSYPLSKHACELSGSKYC